MDSTIKIPERIPDDLEGRSDQSAWHTARTLAALCNGSSPTVQRIKSVVGDTVPFEYSSHITRSLVHIEHNYSDPATRVSIRQLINDFVMIPD